MGLNKLVGALHVGGQVVPYTAFVAPGLLASSAMNGAIFDSTFNIYFKLKIAKTYDAMLSTPLGAGRHGPGRAHLGAHARLLLFGLFPGGHGRLGYVLTPWAVSAFRRPCSSASPSPATGMAATSYMRSWQDFDMVSLAIIPLFLFSATFYPLSVYPAWLQVVVRCTPLYQGVALIRGLDAGLFSWSILGHALYLAAMGFVGLAVTGRRLASCCYPDLPDLGLVLVQDLARRWSPGDAPLTPFLPTGHFHAGIGHAPGRGH